MSKAENGRIIVMETGIDFTEVVEEIDECDPATIEEAIEIVGDRGWNVCKDAEGVQCGTKKIEKNDGVEIQHTVTIARDRDELEKRADRQFSDDENRYENHIVEKDGKVFWKQEKGKTWIE